MPTNKKSQMQMGETIGVLAVFFMIGLVAFVFYFRVAKSNIEQKAEEVKDLTSVAIVQRLMSLPELQCSDNNIVRENCVDLIKLEKMGKEMAEFDFSTNTKKNPSNLNGLMATNQLSYFDLFGNSEIKFFQIYPQTPANAPNMWTLYDNNPNKPGKTTHPNKRQTNIPITIYNPIEDKNYFGVIEISTYSK